MIVIALIIHNCGVVSDPTPTRREISCMADPSLIKEIKQALSIPVMAKARVGHFVEVQILEQIGVDYIDESEELRIADENHFMNKHNFGVKFVCGCRDLGEVLRRVREGSAMIRTQGEIKGFGECEPARLANYNDITILPFHNKLI